MTSGESRKISDLEFYLVEVPRSGASPPVVSLLVRLATDKGLEGWGEAHLPWRKDELAARRDALLPVLAGRSVFDLADLVELDSLAQPALRCAVEMACLDLLGRSLGQPICNLLGGIYRKRAPLAVRLPSGPVQHVAQAARELAEVGFRVQIVSLSGAVEEDLATVAHLRDMLGDRAELRLDGQRRYSFDDARQLVSELPTGGLQYLVDPLVDRSLERLAALGHESNVPLAVGAGLRSAADVFAAVRTGAVACAVLDLEALGGGLAVRQCAAVTSAAGVSAALGGRPTLGIGTAALLQVAAATAGLATANESAYHQLTDDVLCEPLHVQDGMLEVPQGPGLGVEIDRAKIERYQLA